MDNNDLELLYRKLENDDINYEYEEDTLAWYYKAISLPRLTKEEELILLKQISSGDKRARKIFIQRNLRLVKFISSKYINRGLPTLDIIQEGSIGLIKAVDGYDLNSGISFSTYAYNLIKNTIKRAIDEKGRIISLPIYKIEELNKIKRAINDLSLMLQRTPSKYELTKYLNMDVNDVLKTVKYKEDAYLITDLIYDNNNNSRINKYFIYEQVFFENKDNVLYDILKNTNLNEKELLFIKLYYGINGSKQYTQNQIKEIMHLSKQRVSQIKQESLIKLKKTAVRLKYIDK